VSSPPAYSALDQTVQFLKGVGPKRAERLRRIGLLYARDVLFHVPRRYVDASTVLDTSKLEPGMEATVIGRVVAKGVIESPVKRFRIFQAVVRDDSGLIECSWPGQPFLDRVIQKDDVLLVTGSVRFFHGRQLVPREYVILTRASEQEESSGRVIPIYPSTEGITQHQFRTLIAANLDSLLEAAEDEEVLDAGTLARAGVPPLRQALEWLHRPGSAGDAERGRQRLAFEELFFQQLLHAMARHQATALRPGIVFERRDRLVRPLYRSLPFQLTGAQKRVLREIGEDMASPRRMNRLLQGDVGAGKTVVALFAMLRAVENGYQAALMAPTEILAEQHVRTLSMLLDGLPVPVRLLTGRMGAAARRESLAALASGEPAIVVGTHALIQEKVEFGRLGLVVVDEQHRFGVRQRMALVEMGANPDVLVMSATPIPRSLALTLYGDLDISVLDERPPGRQPVRTAIRSEAAREGVHHFVREQIRRGRQAYMVYPLVEESEKLELKAATEEYRVLSEEAFPDLRLGLIHGQMPGEEKDRVMRAFAAGELDVMVSTTVIEVGIDVANATVMVIEHAERFGLSQLHQLRGRVGRGAEESYCVLLTAVPEARQRLKIFASTDDGFQIAQEDMRLRGQGDLFGSKQHGVPEFRYADLERDERLLGQAREEARRLIEADPSLAGFPRLRERLHSRFEERMKLFQVG
jgi:ATP-dependent DNA helicase RecG